MSSDDPASPSSSHRSASLDRHRAMIAHAREQVAVLSASQGEAGQQDPDGTDPCEPPEEIDGYELLTQIYRGGQGVVYRAIQRSTNRPVAIKLLAHGAFASLHERQRFEREVSLLAHLNVPGIVRIVDSGVARGRWWFAMDFIDGVPLDQVPRDRRTIIALMAAIAETLHAAHLRGVIHRDLKPRNILVDTQGRPHILDFGLAAFDATQPSRQGVTESITNSGQFVGSLPWASPEHVAGTASSVDLRSDLYALGIILYQLVTDHFPYRVIGPLHRTTQAIVHDAPVAPRSLDATIDSDLETILLTALQKDPDRRYQSAAAFARDLRSYLQGEPLEARRDSRAYVVRRWIARHRLAATAIALAIISVCGATILFGVLWRQAVEAHDRAETEARSHAAVLAFLERAIERGGPGSGSPGEFTVAELAHHAERQLAGPGANDPLIEAAVRYALARVHHQLGRFEDAASLAEASRVIRERMLPRPHIDIARSLTLLATIKRRQGLTQESTALAAEATSMLRALEGAVDDPAIASLFVELAWSSSPGAQDDAAGATGQRNDPESMLREAIAILERSVPPEDERLLVARLNLMIHSHGSANFAECASLVETLSTHLGPEHEATIAGLKMLSAMHAMQGRPEEAKRSMRQALDATRSLFGHSHPLAIDTLLTYAQLVAKHDGPRPAYDLLDQERSAARLARGETSIGWAQYLIQLGSLGSRLNLDAAESDFENAVAALATHPAPPDVNDARALIELALLQYRRGDATRAEATARACCEIPASSLPPYHWTQAQAQALLGQCLLDRGTFAEAEATLLAAHRSLPADPERNRNALRGTVEALARLYEEWQQVDPQPERQELARRWAGERERLTPASREERPPG